GHVSNDSCQVNGRFHARVATADNGYAFPFKQWSIAVWAVSHTFTAIFLFTRNIHLSPACAGSKDNALALQACTAGQFDFDGIAVNQLFRTVQVNDIHIVILYVLFQFGSQFGFFGGLNLYTMFNRQYIQNLSTETFGLDTIANTLARWINGC